MDDCDKSGIEANLIQTVGDSFPSSSSPFNSLIFYSSFSSSSSLHLHIQALSVCRSIVVAATQFFFLVAFLSTYFPLFNNSVLTIIKAPPSICHQHYSLVSVAAFVLDCCLFPLRLQKVDLTYYQGTTMLI